MAATETKGRINIINVYMYTDTHAHIYTYLHVICNMLLFQIIQGLLWGPGAWTKPFVFPRVLPPFGVAEPKMKPGTRGTSLYSMAREGRSGLSLTHPLLSPEKTGE